MEINLYHSFSDEYLPVLDEKIKNNIEDTIELEHPNVDNKKKEVIQKTSHPKCYAKLKKKHIQEFKNDNCLFVRKISSKCNIDLIYDLM